MAGVPFDPFEQWRELARLWNWPVIAPQQLSQAILPGWSLVSVNETNSAAPDTERAIVAQASYGRQLGRLMDAVTALIAERPQDAARNAAYSALEVLAKDIAEVKHAAAARRIEGACADLDTLRKEAPDEFAAQKAAVLKVLKNE